MSNFILKTALEKMDNHDKDFRYMALSDLATELQNEAFKMDLDQERRVCTKVVKLLLEDTSGDVQGMAIKTLGPLLRKVNENQTGDMIDSIADTFTKSKKKETRDIAGVGLKTIISESPISLGSTVQKRLAPRLLTALTGDQCGPEVKLDCLEVLADLLQRFGTLIDKDLARIQSAVLSFLTSDRSQSRKRAIICVGHLSVCVNDHGFNDLIQYLINNCNKASKVEHARSFIQAIGTVSRSSGLRLAKFLETVVPIVISTFQKPAFQEDEELRESCFQAFETLLLRCPKEMSPYVSQIIQLAIRFISHDPNFVDDEDEEMADAEEEEQEEEEEDDQHFSDDDDVSWKVRRAASKTIYAVIATRPDLLDKLYDEVGGPLVARFKEREENVKLDIFQTFSKLVKETRSSPASREQTLPKLLALLPKIVTGIAKQLKEKSQKVRIAAFGVLKELLVTKEGIFTDYIDPLVNAGNNSLKDKSASSNLKIEALSFFRGFLNTHPTSRFHAHVPNLVDPVLRLVDDSYYKISAEALRVVSALLEVIRPQPGSSFDYHPYIKKFYSAILKKLKAQEIDQEVKEAAIHSTGLLIAHFGNDLAKETGDVLNILKDRLNNEITRLSAVRALGLIAGSTYSFDLRPFFDGCIGILSSFLRKAHRPLKQSTLITLNTVYRNYGANMSVALITDTLNNLAPLISDTDFQLAHLSLQLTITLLKVIPSSLNSVREVIYPKVLELLKSQLLQGAAVDSLLEFYAALVASNSPNFGFDQILATLLGLATGLSSRQSHASVAQCIGVVCTRSSLENTHRTVVQFLKDVSDAKPSLTASSSATAHVIVLSLHSLGEIGRQVDLSRHTGIQDVIFTMFASSNEDVRASASFAIGNITVGNMAFFLPFLLQAIRDKSKNEYLLLQSVAQIIIRLSTSEGVAQLQPYLHEIRPLLLQNSQSDEDGIRNIVADCLGRLALLNPTEMSSIFLENLNSPSANTRTTILTAIKFTIQDKPHPIDAFLDSVIKNQFLSLMKDESMNVRRAVLLAFNFATHNKISLILDVLPSFLPLLYGETVVKPELQREVLIGPFKHKVDGGLETRKAAFECMYTLLDTCLYRLNAATFIDNVINGLKDVYDIKMLSHMMVCRLCVANEAALLEALPKLIEPLRVTITNKLKDGAIKQDKDRNEECIRSALRAVLAIYKIPNSCSVLKFDEFMKQTVTTGEIAQKFEAIRAESEKENATEPMDLS